MNCKWCHEYVGSDEENAINRGGSWYHELYSVCFADFCDDYERKNNLFNDTVD